MIGATRNDEAFLSIRCCCFVVASVSCELFAGWMQHVPFLAKETAVLLGLVFCLWIT